MTSLCLLRVQHILFIDRKWHWWHHLNPLKNFQKLDLDVEDLSISTLDKLIEENPSLLRRPIISIVWMQIGFNEDEIRAFLPRGYRKKNLEPQLCVLIFKIWKKIIVTTRLIVEHWRACFSAFFNDVEQAYEQKIQAEKLLQSMQSSRKLFQQGRREAFGREFETVSGYSLYSAVQEAKRERGKGMTSLGKNKFHFAKEIVYQAGAFRDHLVNWMSYKEQPDWLVRSNGPSRWFGWRF